MNDNSKQKLFDRQMKKKFNNIHPQVALLGALLHELSPLGIVSSEVRLFTPPENGEHGPYYVRYRLELAEPTQATRARPVGQWIENALEAVEIFTFAHDESLFNFNGCYLNWGPPVDGMYNGVQVVVPLNTFPAFASLPIYDTQIAMSPKTPILEGE